MATDPSSRSASDIDRDYVSSNEALAILGVKPQTLYSYVSRGQVRRLTHPASRTSFYHRHDIERLRARSIARSGHGPAAASAMHWGEPILETAITEITAEGPRYRHRLATDLARGGYSFEAVADYLWTGELGNSNRTWRTRIRAAISANDRPRLAGAHIRHVLTRTLAALDLTVPKPAISTATSPSDVIRTMAAAFGHLGPRRTLTPLRSSESIARGLARGLGVKPHRANLAAIDAALVLVADHELTPPTFVARIAASVGSDLAACVLAALQVHFGSLLAHCSDRLENLIEFGARPGRRSARIGSDLALLRAQSRFEHPLYSRGDPRARMLLDLALSLDDGREVAAATLRALEPFLPDVHQKPQLSEALVVLCRALGMRQQTAGGLLALGRAAGWIAHVYEQREQSFIIRPRGKFSVGADL